MYTQVVESATITVVVGSVVQCPGIHVCKQDADLITPDVCRVEVTLDKCQWNVM